MCVNLVNLVNLRRGASIYAGGMESEEKNPETPTPATMVGHGQRPKDLWQEQELKRSADYPYAEPKFGDASED